MKVSDAILPQGQPPELLDLLDQIIAILNNGRYQLRVIEEEPDFVNSKGEMLIQVSEDGATKKLWFFDGEVWNSITFDADTNTLPAATIVGEVRIWAGATASPPSGWLICNGAAASRTTYADLFAVIGTTYGVGDGSTTFNLPDCADRFIMGVGAAVGALGVSGGDLTGTGAVLRTADASDSAGTQPDGTDGSTESSNTHTHKYPKYLSMNYIIKT